MILNRTFVCYNKTAYEENPTPWDATGSIWMLILMDHLSTLRVMAIP